MKNRVQSEPLVVPKQGYIKQRNFDDMFTKLMLQTSQGCHFNPGFGEGFHQFPGLSQRLGQATDSASLAAAASAITASNGNLPLAACDPHSYGKPSCALVNTMKMVVFPWLPVFSVGVFGLSNGRSPFHHILIMGGWKHLVGVWRYYHPIVRKTGPRENESNWVKRVHRWIDRSYRSKMI